MTQTRLALLAILIVGIIGAILFLESKKPQVTGQPTNIGNTVAGAGGVKPAIELVNPVGFINTDKIAIKDLIGKKVILVDFWTYSCINCMRTTPYLNAWYDKYSDQGLEIIGVHTPEFEFEKKYDNVAAAVKKFGIKYPVVLDSNYETWKAYGNQYWPRKYLIDINGDIVYDHIGEGDYDVTEKKIQELLADRLKVLGQTGSINQQIASPSNVIAFTPGKVQSPETYFGYTRNSDFGNGKDSVAGIQTLNLPTQISENKFYLGGNWNFDEEYASNISGGAKIVYRFFAKSIYMVGSASDGVKLKLVLDGKPLGKLAGEDVIDDTVSVSEERLYKLVTDPNGYGQHVLEITIDKPGLKIYTFTFG